MSETTITREELTKLAEIVLPGLVMTDDPESKSTGVSVFLDGFGELDFDPHESDFMVRLVDAFIAETPAVEEKYRASLSGEQTPTPYLRTLAALHAFGIRKD